MVEPTSSTSMNPVPTDACLGAVGSLAGREVQVLDRSQLELDHKKQMESAKKAESQAMGALEGSAEQTIPSLQGRVEDEKGLRLGKPRIALTLATILKLIINWLLRRTHTPFKEAAMINQINSCLNKGGSPMEVLSTGLQAAAARASSEDFFKLSSDVLHHLKGLVEQNHLSLEEYGHLSAQVLEEAGKQCPKGGGTSQETSAPVKAFATLAHRVIAQAQGLDERTGSRDPGALSACLRRVLTQVSDLSYEGTINEATLAEFQRACLPQLVDGNLAQLQAGRAPLAATIKALKLDYEREPSSALGLPKSIHAQLQVPIMDVQASEASAQAIKDLPRFQVTVGSAKIDQPAPQERLEALKEELRSLLPTKQRSSPVFEAILTTVLGQINQGYLEPSQSLFRQIGALPMFSLVGSIQLDIRSSGADSLEICYRRVNPLQVGLDGQCVANATLNVFPTPDSQGLLLIDEEGAQIACALEYHEEVTVRVQLPQEANEPCELSISPHTLTVAFHERSSS